MAQKKGSTYRIVLRGAKGFAQLRYAKTFEIWYGKRRISGPLAFPRLKKKITERRSYLERRIVSIERERLIILEEARAKRARARKKLEKAKLLKVRLRKEKKIIKEQAAKVTSTILAEDQAQIERSSVLLNQETPDFEKARHEAPQTLPFATIKDVLVVPIKPTNKTYTKELIEKIITSNRMTDTLYLTILNFTLTEDYYIPMDLSTFYESYRRALSLMILHVWDFFTETKASSDAYILRVKYAFEKTGKQYFQEQGVSLVRSFGIKSKKDMVDHFIWTFKKFIGESKDRSAPLKKNYLTGDTMIYITGFTLEATTFG
ncbi:MAG: hypothetical protein V4568_08335 [Pseudomonadota bacterium]